MFIVIIKCLRPKSRWCQQKDENGRIWSEAGQLRVIAQNAIIALDTRINHRSRHFPTGLHLNSQSQQGTKLSENLSPSFVTFPSNVFIHIGSKVKFKPSGKPALWRDICNLRSWGWTTFFPIIILYYRIILLFKKFSIIRTSKELILLMLKNVFIHVDSTYNQKIFVRGATILTPAFNLGPGGEVLHPPQRVLGPRFARFAFVSWGNCFANAFCPHFLQTGKPSLANKRLIMSEMKR